MKSYFFIWAFIYFLVNANDEIDSIIQTGELKELENIAGFFFPNRKETFEHFLEVVGQIKKAPENIQKFTEAEKNTNKTKYYQSSLSDCKPSKKCRRENGDCISSLFGYCNGRLIDNACNPKAKCQETYVCCAPCGKPRGKCKRKGGTCVGGEYSYCNGKIISGGCKGCTCCIAWSYSGSLGPKKWSTVYPNCSGKDQSPINLNSDEIIDLTDIIFTNYKDIINASAATSNNQVFAVQIDLNYNLTIQGGGIEDISDLGGFTLTWGSDSSIGSEHTINGTRYPMEMQLIHARFISLDSLQLKFAWLCILFEISDTDNQALDTIIQAASELADQEGLSRFANIENLQLSRLLPSNTQQFYRYQGSWPFPPCTEDVQYTVFTHTSTVSKNQLNVLRSIKIGGKSISNNYRPLQPINGRTIFLNK